MVEAVSQKMVYLLIHARSCFEAVEISRDVKPDFFLIDDQLSSMSGLALYQQLHSMQGLSDVPAIITADTSSGEIGQGMVQYQIMGLKKSFDLDAMLFLMDLLVVL